MARPLSFDPDAALDAAMRTFWQQGFEGASIQDLTEATGLSRSSLYNTWGDKLGLYIAALDRYRRRDGAQAFLPLLRGGDPLDRIQAVFDALVEDATEAPGRGCFMVGATAERGPHCGATRLRARDALSALASSFESAIREAQDRGEVAADKDPEALSHGLVASVYGLRTMARANTPHDTMEHAARGALATLA
ncbi:MAG: TetR/AcrR family transcriptional regulator [Bacteroidota bacterium]